MLLQNANFANIAYYGLRMNRPPPLTDEQRRQALIKAAEARRLRAEIKDLLKMGSLSFEDLLLFIRITIQYAYYSVSTSVKRFKTQT